MKTHSILNKDVVDAQLHTHTHYYALVQQNGPGIPKSRTAFLLHMANIISL